MKFHTVYHTMNVPKRRDYVRITDLVHQAVAESGVKEGMVLVGAMHITAAVFINDWEEGFLQDLDEMLEGIAPFGKDYKHHHSGEDNGDAHMKNILVHPQVILPITKGELDLGPWQQVFYAEFDGRRKKRLIIKVMGE